VAAVVSARANQRLQQELQTQQQAINNGILGQQGQQISQNILQDMVAAAKRNVKIRKLLERYNYRVPAIETTGSATGAPPARATAPGAGERGSAARGGEPGDAGSAKVEE
jgi:hypothetical protein